VKFDLEALLSNEDKLRIVETRLFEEGAHFTSQVRVEVRVRKGWDFAVRDLGDEIKVSFAVMVTSPRFKGAIIECARAISDVVEGRQKTVFSGNPLAEED